MEPLRAVVGLWQHVVTYAVTCADKHKHIESLQRMPADVQQHMMDLIMKLEQCLAAPAEAQRRMSCTPPSSTSLAKRRSQGAGSEAADATPAHLEGDGAEGPTGSTRALVAENDRLRARVAALAEQIERSRTDGRRSARVLEGEFETFERSWQLEKQLQKKDDEIRELSQQVRAGQQAREELQEVTAELEILRAKEQEHATLRARLERCNQRLEEVGELRAALQGAREKVSTVTGERDTLLQELGQLKGVGQQLDAWKSKVHDLELLCKDREGVQRSAESRAREAEEGQERLQAEKAILEDQLLEAKKRCAELSECGPRDADGDIVEPFTAELRERMQRLETANFRLESEVTEKGAERVAALIVEVESLTDLRRHFEARCQETSEALSACEATLADTQEQLRAAEAEGRDLNEKLAERTHDFDRVTAELATSEEEKQSLRDDIAEKEALLEEADRRIAQLEEEHVEAERLQAELDVVHGHGEALREELRLKGEEIQATRERAEQLERRVVAAERQDMKQARLVEELQRDVNDLREAAKKRDDLEESDRIWMQQQRALESGLRDLRAGLEDEARHSTAMRQEAEVAERGRGQLEDLLRRVAPVEYQRFLESAASGHAAPSAPGVTFELAQAKTEIRRLQDALHEQRLRVAEESQELAKTSAQLWRLRRKGVDGSASDSTRRSARDASSGDEASSPAMQGTSDSHGRHAMQEVRSGANLRQGAGGHRLHGSPDRGSGRSFGEAQIRPSVGGLGAPSAGALATEPRMSILKKPKSMEGAGPAGFLQENMPMNFDFSQSSGSRRTTKVGRTVPPMPRRGLIM